MAESEEDMTIDEAIAREREKAKEIRENIIDKNNLEPYESYCIAMAAKCAEEHEQLAEWLEDYKRIKMLIPIEQALKNEYNKAIDDFKKMLTIEKIKEYAESDGFINLNNCGLMIFDIAEQLKECGKNG